MKVLITVNTMSNINSNTKIYKTFKLKENLYYVYKLHCKLKNNHNLYLHSVKIAKVYLTTTFYTIYIFIYMINIYI